MNQGHTASVAAEPNFEFRGTASHWVRHGDRVVLKTPELHGMGVTTRLREMKVLSAWLLGLRFLPTQLCPASRLAMAASSQGAWGLALPPPAPLGRSTVTPIQRSDVGPLGALLPAGHLAQGQGHIPPLVSSTSQRCELPINSPIPRSPEKTNIV